MATFPISQDSDLHDAAVCGLLRLRQGQPDPPGQRQRGRRVAAPARDEILLMILGAIPDCCSDLGRTHQFGDPGAGFALHVYFG